MMKSKVTKGLKAALLSTAFYGLPVAAAEHTQAADANASAVADRIETVLVTARRREEELQKVPVSVTAFSQSVLTDRNISTLNDLQYSVPSLTLNGYQRDSSFVSIRGQGGFSPGAQSLSIVSYLNEVPLPSNSNGGTISGAGLYNDLENVQVLKGPQGTLFGRNTTGGAILLQTKRPTNEFGGYLQGTLGGYDQRALEAVVNAPVIPEKLLVRFAGTREVRDGFTQSLGTPKYPTGIDLDNLDNYSARISVRFIPTETIKNDLIATFADNQSHGTGSVLGAYNPFLNTIFPSIGGIFAQQQALGPRAQVVVDTDLTKETTLWGVTDILAVDFSDNLTLRNIFGFNNLEITIPSDGDGTSLPIINFPMVVPQPLEQDQFTEELQLQGTSLDAKLQWVVGGFYYNSRYVRTYTPTNVVFGRVFPGPLNNKLSSYAGYAQGTYDLSSLMSGLKFTAGVRYTSDHLQAFPAFAGTFGAPTWTLGLDYQVLNDTLVYVTAHRGYRSGGFNTTTGLPVARQTYSPEYVRDVEVGIKTDFDLAGVPARANLDFYHQDYTNIQSTQSTPVPGNPAANSVTNTASANVNGIEFEGTIRPVKGLDIGTQLSWINFKYARPAAGVTLPTVTNIPRYKYGVSSKYTLPTEEKLGEVSLSASWSWQAASYIGTPGSDPRSLQAPYGLLTLGLNWNSVLDSPFDASFYMTNTTNKLYAVADFASYGTVGTSSLVYGAPRMFGFRLKYRFGSEG